MSVTNFIWDQQNYLAEADGSNVINTVYTHEPQEYGRLNSVRRASTTSVAHFDGTGSTTRVTTATEAVSDSWIYNASGQVLSHTGVSTFSMLWIGELGYFYDTEIVSYYVRRRAFSAAVGRWISRDPIFSDEPMNGYDYANNRYLVAVDPSGLALCLDCDEKPDVKCGTYSWKTTFKGTPAQTPGFVIQHITATVDIKKCNNVLVQKTIKCNTSPGPAYSTDPKSESATLEYWEMWYITKSGKLQLPIIDKANNKFKKAVSFPDFAGDIFSSKGGEGTKGNHEVTGKVYFVPGPITAPPKGWEFWFQVPNPTDEPEGGKNPEVLPASLPFTCKDPGIAGGKGVETASRSLKTKWCCCGNEETDYDHGNEFTSVKPRCK